MSFLDADSWPFWIVYHWRVSAPFAVIAGGFWLAYHDQQIAGIAVLFFGLLAALWGLLWTLERNVDDF